MEDGEDQDPSKVLTVIVSQYPDTNITATTLHIM